MRYFIRFSYNGKAYHGWQRQPNAISVQQVLEEAMSKVLRNSIITMGAGRTDTGVHASEMVAHFDHDRELPIEVVFKLNSILPNDIAVENIIEVEPQAHARFDALDRTYKYRISTKKNVFNTDYAFYFYKLLNFKTMNEACDLLFQYRDFQCFSKSNTDVMTYNCTIKKAEWIKVGDEIIFTIKADRFLRNMVRAIVGTLLDIGLGKLNIDDLHQIIKSKDRRKAGFSVPAHGLYLVNIEYPDDLGKR